MQETWVQSRVQEDLTCRKATTPVSHSYWALPVLQPVLGSRGSRCSEKPTHLSPRAAREQPCWPVQQGKARAAMKTQHSKRRIKFKKRERENGKPETGVEGGEVVYVTREQRATEGAEMYQFRQSQDFRIQPQQLGSHGKTVREGMTDRWDLHFKSTFSEAR